MINNEYTIYFKNIFYNFIIYFNRYGFHSDNEQKCWDYDSVNRNERIVNENE